jgi:hypothetical protein
VYIDVKISVAEPHQSDAAPVLGKNVDAAPPPAAMAPAPATTAPAPATTAPAPTLLYTKPTYLKQTKVINRVKAIYFFFFLLIQIITKLNGKSKTLSQFVTFVIEHLCMFDIWFGAGAVGARAASR